MKLSYNHGTLTTTVEVEEKKPHETEPDAAWIFRVLCQAEPSVGDKVSFGFVNWMGGPDADFLPSGYTRVRVRRDGVHQTTLEVKSERAAALMSVAGMAKHHPQFHDWENDCGVALVLLDDKKNFFLTMKDHEHPNEACRGRYSLISGGREKHEPSRWAICRETYEEVRYARMVDEIFSADEEYELRRRLPSVQWPGDYMITTTARLIRKPEAFRRAWDRPDVLSEGIPVVKSASEVEDLIGEEEKNPGSMFVASHHLLLAHAMRYFG